VVLALAPGALGQSAAASAATPTKPAVRGPVGWDTFRRLDRLPTIREGVHTRQVSSADPTGGNDDGYTGRWSCMHPLSQGCLLARHRGPGELESVWSAGAHYGDVSGAGHLRIELDGRMVVDAPFQDIVDGRLGGAFVSPLVQNAGDSSGGFSVDVPMPFRHEMRVFTEANPGYYHVVYRTFDRALGIRTFTRQSVAPDVLAELHRAGRRDPKPPMGHPVRLRRTFALRAGRDITLARLRGSGAITTLGLRLRRLGHSEPGARGTPPITDALRGLRLLASFDGRQTVNAPLGEFFGSGLGRARVRALLFAMDPRAGGWATSWWPMPYGGRAVVRLRNASHSDVAAGDLRLTAARSPRWRAALGPRGNAGLFHARGHRGPTRPDAPWTLLRARGTGTFTGVTVTMEGPAPPRYLEGDEQGFVDGARRPALEGTGTEDFFGGAWYFYERLFSLPLTGYPRKGVSGPICQAASCTTAYRLMVADAVPFRRSLHYVLEHGDRNSVPAVYGSTAYWYARP
jgi:hypothetical protein